MQQQTTVTQMLYSQLQEEAAAYSVMLFEQGVAGSPYRNKSGKYDYIYWQVTRPDGTLHQFSLGRDTPETAALVESLLARKRTTEEAIDALKSTTGAFLASGGMAVESAHFKVIENLARAGLFSKGLALVGSHAFTSIGNMLGVRWGGNLKTSDMDFARPSGVALAIPDSGNVIDVPAIVKAGDASFFPIPELNHKHPSTSMMSSKTKVKIDFLTVQRNGADSAPHYFNDLSIAAAPLRFMDYLIGGESCRGLIVGTYPIPVNLPDPARFAIHKLVIAQERTFDLETKVAKDVRQATEVIEALIDLGREHELRRAVTDLIDLCGNKSVTNLRKSLEKMDGEPKQLVESAVQKCLLDGLSSGAQTRSTKAIKSLAKKPEEPKL